VIRVRRQVHLAFLTILGAFLALQAFGALLGWNGRAPDVGYGDEMNFPEEVILFLVTIALYRRSNHAKFFAASMAILNGIVAAFDLDVFTLARPVAFSWAGIWTALFVTASWSSIRRFIAETKRNQLKTS